MDQACIVFNFNGVLVNTKLLAVELFNQIAKMKGYRSIHVDQIESLRRLSIRDRCKVLGVPLYQMPIVGISIKARYQEALSKLEAVEGISALLSSLKERDYKIGFITTNSKRAAHEFLQHNQMNRFDFEHYSFNPFTKFRNLNQLVHKYNIKKENLIFVGDELRDIKAGNRAGIKSIGVTWGYDSSDLFQQGNPAYIAHRPNDILSFLEGE